VEGVKGVKFKNTWEKQILKKNDNQKKIDLSRVKPGVYVILIFEGNELINRQRVIKK